VHAWHSCYYIRRMRINKEESIYSYLQQKHPALLEDDVMNPEQTAVLSFPQQAPPNATLRTEPALSLLERVRQLHQHWILPGHRQGANTNNVSTTVSVRPEEWQSVGEWMWKHRNAYNGLCVLPYSEHSYAQAPFEECSREVYETLLQQAYNVDLSRVREERDETAFQMAPACSGNSCEVVVA